MKTTLFTVTYVQRNGQKATVGVRAVNAETAIDAIKSGALKDHRYAPDVRQPMTAEALPGSER